jgi:hypothetical protein
MKIHIPNSAFLGNINQFISKFDPSDPDRLDITAHPKWFWVHPVVLCMIAALGRPVKPENISCDIVARTGHYLKRMGLYGFLGIESGITIEEYEPAGRFIPLTPIKTSDDLSHFLYSAVSNFELGTREPDLIIVLKYARLAKVPMENLVDDKLKLPW